MRCALSLRGEKHGRGKVVTTVSIPEEAVQILKYSTHVGSTRWSCVIFMANALKGR